MADDEPLGAEIQAVGRAAQILAMLSNEHPQLTIARVAEVLGFKRTTAHRYLNSLAAAGFLSRDEESLAFVPGELAVQLGALALGRRKVLERAARHMRHVSGVLRMSVVLSLWGLAGPVVVQVNEDVSRLAITTVPVGTQLPLESAQAVLFLAYSAEQLDALRLTATLPPDQRRDLERQVEEARAAGIAMRSYDDGSTALAVPVFDATGICATLAVVSATILISRQPDADVLLCTAARELSHELGGEAFATARRDRNRGQEM